jgi:hypothetical protein
MAERSLPSSTRRSFSVRVVVALEREVMEELANRDVRVIRGVCKGE